MSFLALFATNDPYLAGFSLSVPSEPPVPFLTHAMLMLLPSLPPAVSPSTSRPPAGTPSWQPLVLALPPLLLPLTQPPACETGPALL